MNRSPFNGRLLAWGHAPGGWWGLVEFAQRITRDGKLDQLAIAAWLPADALTRPIWVGTGRSQVARITLPFDQADWPAPAAWHGWYAGAWLSGSLRLPDGSEIATGPAWRRR